MTTSTATPIPTAGGREPPRRRVTLGTPVPVQAAGDELLQLAAAAAPVGSQDPADRALLQAAAGLHDVRHFVQEEVQRATAQQRVGMATLRAGDGSATRVLRGEVNAVLQRMGADPQTAAAARKLADRVERSGLRALTVAVADLGADGQEIDWRLAGIIPLRAQRAVRVHEAATDWDYVKLWDPALRFMHWIAVGCIVTLIGTGYMIATPFLAPGTAAAQPFLMGWIRLAHFIAAGLLIATAVVRIADLFLSPYPYARWQALWPINNRAEARATLDVLEGYLFLRPHRNPTWVGLNPLQAITYTAIYGLALLMVVTGLALFGLYNPAQWPYSWFQWLNTWLGADMVRTIHYIGMWLFLIFIPAHIYLSVRSDTVDRSGAISSMFNGGVWVRKHAPIIDADSYRPSKES